ncbi:MAG: hypothetical protein ACO1NS_00815 [Daejeonella sp.]
MRFPVVHLRFLPASGMAIFPFVLIKYPELKQDRQIINHELIHLRQQLELLILPFFLLYLINYLVNLIKYRSHHQAYRNIVFEREAYTHDSNYSYLRSRRFFAWIAYL